MLNYLSSLDVKDKKEQEVKEREALICSATIWPWKCSREACWNHCSVI